MKEILLFFLDGKQRLEDEVTLPGYVMTRCQSQFSDGAAMFAHLTVVA